MYSALASPEFKLILETIQCSSTKLSEVDSQIDETNLSNLMHRHRVGSLVYSKLSDSKQFSESFHLKWTQEVLQNQKTALIAKRFQLQFGQRLNERKIKHVFLKGVSLSERYYTDLALRHVLDVDLLVSEGDIELVSDLLVDFGLKREKDYELYTPTQKRFLHYVNHDMPFFGDGTTSPAIVELHWKWRGALGGFNLKDVRSLDEVELLLYLSVHGTEHGWFRLKWLVDLFMIIRQSTLNWTSVRQRAIELECLEHLEISLKVLLAIFSQPLPIGFQYLNDNTLHRRKLDYIFTLMSDENGFNANDSNRWKHFQYLFSLSKQIMNIRLLLKYMISPLDWKIIPLPDTLFFLYIPLKPFVWVFRRIKSN